MLASLKTIPFISVLFCSSIVFAQDADETQSVDSTIPVEEASPSVEFKNLQQKTSYILGVDIAKKLNLEGIDINPHYLLKGLLDVIHKDPLAMSKSEMDEATEAAKEIQIEQKLEDNSQQAEQNAIAGKSFMEAYAEQDKVLTTENNILYKVLVKGEGAPPSDHDSVFVNYVGKLVDGTEFDNSYKRGHALKIIPIDVIEGWREIIKRMNPGSKWEVVIPPNLAYGETGYGKMIGPNQTLIFTIEMISFGRE